MATYNQEKQEKSEKLEKKLEEEKPTKGMDPPPTPAPGPVPPPPEDPTPKATGEVKPDVASGGQSDSPQPSKTEK